VSGQLHPPPLHHGENPTRKGLIFYTEMCLEIT